MNSKFSPDHYRQGIETWDYICSHDLGYLEGNIIKYITRAGKKHNETKLDDLLKAKAYLHKLINNEVHTGSPGPSDQVQDSDGTTDGDIYSFESQAAALFDR
tara:strand:+ start:253 stop:558 length:306 start_codon:yes stop_codon:yes gene_type:complete